MTANEDKQTQGFPVEFADGPHKGTRLLLQPIESLPVELPVPLCDKNDVVAVAVYQRCEVKGKWRYYLLSIDDSREKREEFKAGILRCAIDGHYTARRESIYSKKPGKHRQMYIEHGHRRGRVDEGIAQLVLQVWRHGFDTAASCQELRSGEAYVDFPYAEQGDAFSRGLSEAGIGSRCKEAALGVQAVEKSRIEFKTLSVFFSSKDISRIVDLLRSKTFDG